MLSSNYCFRFGMFSQESVAEMVAKEFSNMKHLLMGPLSLSLGLC